MSGINEFNSIQPEQFNIEVSDKRTGKKLLATALLTALVITVAAAFGFTINKYSDDPYKALIEHVAGEIDLNEQQKTEVNRIKEEVSGRLENRNIRHVSGGREIEALFRSETFDRQNALNIANRQDEENRDVALYVADELEKLHGLLTTDQRNNAVDKVKKLYAEFKSSGKINKLR